MQYKNINVTHSGKAKGLAVAELPSSISQMTSTLLTHQAHYKGHTMSSNVRQKHELPKT